MGIFVVSQSKFYVSSLSTFLASSEDTVLFLFSPLKFCTLDCRKVAVYILSLVLILSQEQIWLFICQAIKL